MDYTCRYTADERPNLYYPIVQPYTGEEVWPSRSRVWAFSKAEHEKNVSTDRIWWGKSGNNRVPALKNYFDKIQQGMVPITSLPYKEVGHTDEAAKELRSFFPDLKATPKPTRLIRHLCLVSPGQASTILDYFAGSGTTGHAIISLNREDGGTRKYILVEMGDYFDTVLKPRIQKVVYSKDWKDGKPVSREGSSQMVKVLRLESYEDALNNLEIRKPTTGQGELDFGGDDMKSFREDYLLHYMLDVETRGSASLLNVDGFRNPFAYELKIASSSAGETQPTNIDLIETFNYLLGLRVKTTEVIRGVRLLKGTSPAGENVLMIWRNLDQVDNAALDNFFGTLDINPRDMEFDLIYVNGDNNLQNLRREDET